jgi:hypothetical protein
MIKPVNADRRLEPSISAPKAVLNARPQARVGNLPAAGACDRSAKLEAGAGAFRVILLGNTPQGYFCN